MLSVLFTIPIVFIAISLFGYVLHRMLHRPYMGRFYKSHLIHHFKLYPVENFTSAIYRDPGKDNTTLVFVMFGLPLIIAPVALWLLHWIALPTFICALLCLAVFGFANNYLHDAFHITEHWLLKYGWFRRMVELHWLHHHDIKTNYGIYFFGWDKFFGTLTSVQAYLGRAKR